MMPNILKIVFGSSLIPQVADSMFPVSPDLPLPDFFSYSLGLNAFLPFLLENAT